MAVLQIAKNKINKYKYAWWAKKESSEKLQIKEIKVKEKSLTYQVLGKSEIIVISSSFA